MSRKNRNNKYYYSEDEDWEYYIVEPKADNKINPCINQNNIEVQNKDNDNLDYKALEKQLININNRLEDDFYEKIQKARMFGYDESPIIEEKEYLERTRDILLKKLEPYHKKQAIIKQDRLRKEEENLRELKSKISNSYKKLGYLELNQKYNYLIEHKYDNIKGITYINGIGYSYSEICKECEIIERLLPMLKIAYEDKLREQKRIEEQKEQEKRDDIRKGYAKLGDKELKEELACLKRLLVPSNINNCSKAEKISISNVNIKIEIIEKMIQERKEIAFQYWQQVRKEKETEYRNSILDSIKFRYHYGIDGTLEKIEPMLEDPTTKSAIERNKAWTYSALESKMGSLKINHNMTKNEASINITNQNNVGGKIKEIRNGYGQIIGYIQTYDKD